MTTPTKGAAPAATEIRRCADCDRELPGKAYQAGTPSREICGECWVAPRVPPSVLWRSTAERRQQEVQRLMREMRT